MTRHKVIVILTITFLHLEPLHHRLQGIRQRIGLATLLGTELGQQDTRHQVEDVQEAPHPCGFALEVGDLLPQAVDHRVDVAGVITSNAEDLYDREYLACCMLCFHSPSRPQKSPRIPA